MMEHTRLGNTGLKVSRLALGCMSYGDPTTPGAHEWSLHDNEGDPGADRRLTDQARQAGRP